MSKKNKVLLTVMVVGIGGALAGFGVFAAFSSTTNNPANTFQAGSVVLGDNDGGASLFDASGLHANTKPGNYDRCIRVTYTGSLDADVKMYTSAITGDGNGMNVTVDKSNNGTAADCSDFGTGGGAVVTNIFAAAPLTTFDNYADYGSGLSVTPIGLAKWVLNDGVTFRFRITVGDNDQNATLNAFQLNWEARNQ